MRSSAFRATSGTARAISRTGRSAIRIRSTIFFRRRKACARGARRTSGLTISRRRRRAGTPRQSANSFLGPLSRPKRALAKVLSNMASFLALHQRPLDRRRRERRSSLTRGPRPGRRRSGSCSGQVAKSAGTVVRRAVHRGGPTKYRGARAAGRLHGSPSGADRPRGGQGDATAWRGHGRNRSRIEADDRPIDGRSGRVATRARVREREPDSISRKRLRDGRRSAERRARGRARQYPTYRGGNRCLRRHPQGTLGHRGDSGPGRPGRARKGAGGLFGHRSRNYAGGARSRPALGAAIWTRRCEGERTEALGGD